MTARVGRPPKGISPRDLEPSVRRMVDAAIDSHAARSAAAIFREFGLAERGVREDTFRRYVTRRRKLGGAGGGETATRGTPTMDEIRERLLVSIYEAAAAGGMKAYELAALLARVQEADRIDLLAAAQQRADELHANKMRELVAKKQAADETLDRMAAEKGIPDDVKARIKDLYGIAV